MDPNSGRIHEDVEPKEARRRGFVPIPKGKIEEVKALTPEQRIEWAARRKKDAAERKAKRKAAKKARRKRRGHR